MKEDPLTNSTSNRRLSNGDPQINMVSEGTLVKGDVTTDDDFRVSGTVDGELEVKGKGIITETGKVVGKIIANDADISGEVEGVITISNKLIVRPTALITGNLVTKVILVEEGARLDCECKMTQNPKNNLQSNIKTDKNPVTPPDNKG